MEPVSIASVTLASILATMSVNNQPEVQSSITTHISPAIAGQWEIDLDDKKGFASSLASSNADDVLASSTEPEITSDNSSGVLSQTEKRVVNKRLNPIMTANKSNQLSKLDNKPNLSASSASQCREIYYFGADNEMWAVSGKERTYARYLVTHPEQGLPIIAIKTIYDNNEIDCSGNKVDQTDEALIAFFKHEGNQMQWCADPDGKECFMSFNRILP